jgi:hypothetical protein
MSAKQSEKDYCDAVYELLLEDPEQSMTLATLGTFIPKPSKKASSKRILAADGRFDVTESDCMSHVVVSLRDDGEHLPEGDVQGIFVRLAQLALASGAMSDSRLDRSWLRNTLSQQQPADNFTAIIRHYATLASEHEFEALARLVEKIASGDHPVFTLPQHEVAVSGGSLIACRGDMDDAKEEVASRPVPSAARAGGSAKPVSRQQQQLPASQPESPVALPPSSPSELQTFYKGAIVRIVGLKSRADLNGCPGLVLGEMDSSCKRWPVTVTKGRDSEDVLLLAANMTIVTDEHAFDDVSSQLTSHLQDDIALRVTPCASHRASLSTQYTAHDMIDAAADARLADHAARIPDDLRSAFESLQLMSSRRGQAAVEENVDVDWGTVVKKVSAC